MSESTPRFSNTTLRVLTALVGAPIFIGLTYLGGWAFAALIALAAVVAQYELYRMMKAVSVPAWRHAGGIAGILLVLAQMEPALLWLAVLVGVGLLAVTAFRTPSPQAIHVLSGTVLGALYPAGMLGFLVGIRESFGATELDAFFITLAAILFVWAADIGAYYVGRAIGKNALAPRVSPKKTIEGAVGGLLGSVVVGLALYFTVLTEVGWIHVLVLSICAGVAAQLGDLSESRLKRSAQVKDSGTILPGHGGVFDRLDGLIVVAPVVYLYLRFVVG